MYIFVMVKVSKLMHFLSQMSADTKVANAPINELLATDMLMHRIALFAVLY